MQRLRAKRMWFMGAGAALVTALAFVGGIVVAQPGGPNTRSGVGAAATFTETGTYFSNCQRVGYNVLSENTSLTTTLAVYNSVALNIPCLSDVLVPWSVEVSVPAGRDVLSRVQARCVAPAVAGGCTVGSTITAEPDLSGSDQFFISNSPNNGGGSSFYSLHRTPVFNNLLPGNYVFEGLARTNNVTGNPQISFRTLTVQTVQGINQALPGGPGPSTGP